LIGVNRKETPVAFFASVLIHLMVLVAVARWLDTPRPVPEIEPEAPTPERMARVMLPPPEVWRPPAPPSEARRAPVPKPRPEAKDRVSIGGPSDVRQKTPLELRRDEDLTRTIARGRPDATGGPVALPPRPEPGGPETAAEIAEAPLAPTPRPVGPPPSSGRPSIAESLRTLDERLAARAARGLESGTVRQMGTSPLLFDDQGADFTAWTNHFKNEVYRNWIMPTSVAFGAQGQVDLQFRVERDGRVSGLRIVRSSGTPALDRAAANALWGSRFPPLPDDFRPAQVVMDVSFFYNRTAGS